MACSGAPASPPDPAHLEQGGVDAGAEEESGIFFSGDPFADPEVEVVRIEGGNRITQEHLWSGERPVSQLVELEAVPGLVYDEAVIQRAAELGLARLRARYLTDVLCGSAKVLVPEGIRTFGEVLPIRFRVRNPLGDPIELLPSEAGFLFELDWTVERWLPIGGHDRVQRHRFFRLSQRFLIESDQEFLEYLDLPLVVEGDQGAVWWIEIDARLRCNGATFEQRVLPVHQIEFQAARFLVLPPGWEQFRDDPLGNLQRVLTMPSEQVDRHVLVNVALLRGDDRQRGVETLLQGLREPPNDRRALTITQALQWLTGVPLGLLREDWLRWEAQRKLSATR